MQDYKSTRVQDYWELEISYEWRVKLRVVRRRVNGTCVVEMRLLFYSILFYWTLNHVSLELSLGRSRQDKTPFTPTHWFRSLHEQWWKAPYQTSCEAAGQMSYKLQKSYQKSYETRHAESIQVKSSKKRRILSFTLWVFPREPTQVLMLKTPTEI